jgi:murein L,D-transpeptidase YcbB/YkuD
VLSEQSGRDVVELKRMLHALGHFRKEAESLPSPREDRSLSLFDAEVVEAVEVFRKEAGLPVAEDRLGYPRGLVDAACVAALRARFEALPREKREAAMPRGR